MIDAREQQRKRMERAAKLACEAVDECRVQLMLKFRFLDLALWRMPLEPVYLRTRYPLATDAHAVFLEPEAVFARFEESFDEMVRDYLHLVLHCIFRHPFDRQHEQHPAWWLACDVLVESVALEICGHRFESPDDVRRRELIAGLKMQMGKLTPNLLYDAFRLAMGSPQGDSQVEWTQSHLVEMQALFERDGHESWPGYAKAEKTKEPDMEFQGADSVHTVKEEHRSEEEHTALEAKGEESEDAGSDENERNDAEGGQDESDGPEQGTSQDAESADPDNPEESEESGGEDFQGMSMFVSQDDATDELPDDRQENEDEQAWEEISKQIETDLETFSSKWGDEAGGLIDAIALTNRRTYDYTEFLKRFSSLAEDMRLNDEEFDYIFYTHGMDLYGNMPLIEPLEYVESDRVREFVIAIDTSGSVQGELVRRFVEHTFEILKESERFHDAVDIHIIQCDARIQSDTRITSMEQLGEYLETFYVSGFGGTDFRPVFDYVEKLRDRGELQDLRGLVYFTDGLGIFPKSPPPYDVAFAFVEDEQQDPPSVPPWAMKVMIDREAMLRD